jgi:hypothetical protein
MVSRAATRCRRCSARRLNSDPGILARREAGQQAFFADPATKAALAARIGRYIANMPDDDRERRRRHGQQMAREAFRRPDAVAKNLSPEVRARAGAKRSSTVLAWCPDERRAEYRALVRKGFTAGEARRAIEADIPGTKEHARREVAQNRLRMLLKHQRDLDQRY